MANNYLSFSEKIIALDAKEKKWINGIPLSTEEKYEDDEIALRDALEKHGIDTKSIKDTIEMFPSFDFTITEEDWWIYTEESGGIDHVACVVQAFIKKFRPRFVFTLTWCEYCDKPRIGEFGGGAMVVTKDKIRYWNTWTQARRTALKMEKKV